MRRSLAIAGEGSRRPDSGPHLFVSGGDPCNFRTLPLGIAGRCATPRRHRPCSRPRELHALGLLTNVTAAALGSYCIAYSRLMKAVEHLEADGLTFTTPNGYVMPSPWLAIANTAMKQFKDFGVEFGLSQLSEARIPKSGKVSAEDDEMDKLLTRATCEATGQLQSGRCPMAQQRGLTLGERPPAHGPKNSSSNAMPRSGPVFLVDQIA